MLTKRVKQSGFTIVELLVVISVLSILIGLVLSTLSDFYQADVTSLSQTVQSTDTLSVLRSIESDLVTSSGFLTTTSMAPVSPTGSDNAVAAWSYTGNDAAHPNNRVLISSSYATDKSTSDVTRSLVLCDPNSQPLVNNVIYFVAKDPNASTYDLYRRIMVGSGTNCTATPFQKQTCAPAMRTNPVCQASDAVLLSDISTFTVDYYATPNQQVPITDEYNTGAASIPAAQSIKITVTVNRKIGSITTPYSSSLRISLIH